MTLIAGIHAFNLICGSLILVFAPEQPWPGRNGFRAWALLQIGSSLWFFCWGGGAS